MIEKINNVNIIPARFLKKSEDGKCLMRVLNNDVIENRYFDSHFLEKIINPDYIFISIITGDNILRVDFFDAKEYKKLFKDKWKNLIN